MEGWKLQKITKAVEIIKNIQNQYTLRAWSKPIANQSLSIHFIALWIKPFMNIILSWWEGKYYHNFRL